jgi:hypothetical protein
VRALQQSPVHHPLLLELLIFLRPTPSAAVLLFVRAASQKRLEPLQVLIQACFSLFSDPPCCHASVRACSKFEEVGTCASVTAEPGPASLAAGATNVLQLSQSGNPQPPRDTSTCDTRARFNYKVSVGPVKGDQCGAYQVRQGLEELVSGFRILYFVA